MVRTINSHLESVPQGLTRPRIINVTVCECANCGLEFNGDYLEESDFRALYTEGEIYSTSGYAYQQDITPKYSVDIYQVINRTAPMRGRLLEIGFLETDLMEGLQEQGWSVEGVELDKQAVERAKEQGYTVYEGDIQDPVFDDKHYDAIIAIAVLEHVENPNRFVDRLYQLLSPGGIVLLQLPNPGSLNAYVSAFSSHGWDMYGEPGHVFHYKKHHLTQLLKKHGFDVPFYSTATIRIRGKVPFLPSRNVRLENQVADLFHRFEEFRRIYTSFLKMLDRFELGDTHLVVGRKRVD